MQTDQQLPPRGLPAFPICLALPPSLLSPLCSASCTCISPFPFASNSCLRCVCECAVILESCSALLVRAV